MGGIVGLQEDKALKRTRLQFKEQRIEHVQCFPFYSVMAAMGNPRIDYFSLDVEGSELGILKTIPFDQVSIGLMTIEVNHYPKAKQEIIKEIMDKNGFDLVKIMNKQDFVFKNRNF